MADIKSGVSGQTVGLKLEAATDITSDASAVNGTFPISGNLMSVATATNQATASLTNATAKPDVAADIEATADVIVWQNTLTVSQQDVELQYFRLTQIGSIPASALSNIRLDISGTQVATGELVTGAVGQDLIFDLSASPVKITKGQTKTITVYADIVGGASKTMRLGLEKKVDILLKDLAYGCYVGVSGTVPNRTAIQTIKTGSVTITKATDSPSANVILAASGVSLAKFKLNVYGEEIKLNTLKVQIVYTGTTTANFLRNGMVLLDGVQVGNTTALATASGGTSFSIYQKIPAGASQVLEVKADIFACATTDCTSQLAASGHTVRVKVLGSTTEDNAQGMVSLNMIDVPESDAYANTLTVGIAALSLGINTAYGNQSIAAGSDTKLGAYILTNNGYDTANISGLTVGVATTSVTTTLTDLSNLYVKYDTKTTSIKGSVSAENIFSVTTSLVPGKTMNIEVWGTIKSTAVGGFKTRLAVSATRATDGSDVGQPYTAYAQTISIATGQITVVLAADRPDSGIVMGLSTDVLLNKLTFSALYESFTVKKMTIAATSTPSTTTDDYLSLYLKYKDAAGNEVTSDALGFAQGATTLDLSNLTIYVPSFGTSKVSVYGNMNAVALAGYANCGDRPQLGMTYYESSSGSQPSGTSSANLWGNQMLLYKTKPTVGVRAGITSGTLVSGVNDLYAVTIGADVKGDMGMKKLTFYLAGGMTTSSDQISAFKFYRGDLDITDKVKFSTTAYATSGTATIGPLAGNATYTVAVIFDSEEEIAADAAQTYTLKANVTGVDTTGEYIQAYLLGDSAWKASSTSTLDVMDESYITWTDKSIPVAYHGESEATAAGDWLNGYLVKVLPSQAYTIRK